MSCSHNVESVVYNNFNDDLMSKKISPFQHQSLVLSRYINWWKGNIIDLNRNIKLEYSDVLNEI